jgi:hypothetical protein
LLIGLAGGLAGQFSAALVPEDWFARPVVALAGCWAGSWAAAWLGGWLVTWCHPTLRRFARRTRRFPAASAGRVTLRYAPELHGLVDHAEVLGLAEKTWRELETAFGRSTRLRRWRALGLLLSPRRRRVNLYLFPSCEAVQEVFGPTYAATALPHLHAVVVPYDERRLRESLRHEMTHLFAAEWNESAPPLLAEGLATWLQGTELGEPIDGVAAALLLGEGDCGLRPLLDGDVFFERQTGWRNYLLAGSFTGFLIRRFGWDAYERFYRRQWDHRRVAVRFAKHFGMTLEEAEQRWRSALLQGHEARHVGEWWVRRFD